MYRVQPISGTVIFTCSTRYITSNVCALSHLLIECQMDRKNIDDRLELVCELLDIANQSFDQIVVCYKRVIESLFSDGIYHLGRFFVANYFAHYIVNRAQHVDCRQLLNALSETLEEMWLLSLPEE